MYPVAHGGNSEWDSDRYRANYPPGSHWATKVPCMPGAVHERAINGWRLKNRIPLAAGSFGTVYQACREDDCRYIIKKGQVTPKELEYQEIAAQFGISKPIRDRWNCLPEYVPKSASMKDIAVIVTDKIHMTLNDWGIENKRENRGKQKYLSTVYSIYKFIWATLKQMVALHTKAKIMHNDMKTNNIMTDSLRDKVYIIDYGLSHRVYNASVDQEWVDFCKINRDWLKCGKMFGRLFVAVEDTEHPQYMKIRKMNVAYVTLIKSIGVLAFQRKELALFRNDDAKAGAEPLTLMKSEALIVEKLLNIPYHNAQFVTDLVYVDGLFSYELPILFEALMDRTSDAHKHYSQAFQRKDDWDGFECGPKLTAALRFPPKQILSDSEYSDLLSKQLGESTVTDTNLPSMES